MRQVLPQSADEVSFIKSGKTITQLWQTIRPQNVKHMKKFIKDVQSTGSHSSEVLLKDTLKIFEEEQLTSMENKVILTSDDNFRLHLIYSSRKIQFLVCKEHETPKSFVIYQHIYLEGPVKDNGTGVKVIQVA